MTTPYEEAVLVDSPLALWPLTETSGTRAQDISPNVITADYPADGSVQLAVPGPGNGCLPCALFASPSADTMVVSQPSAFPLDPQQFSLEMWLQLQDPQNRGIFTAHLFGWGTVGSLVWVLQLQVLFGSVTSIGLNFGAGAWSAAPPVSIGLGEWHHVALCIDQQAQQGTLYVDGQAASLPLSPVASPGSIATAAAVIGGWQTGFNWVGGLAEVAFYTSCLTAAQVQAHYAASVCPPRVPPPDWLRLGHSSGRSYIQQNGEQVQMVAGGAGVLDLPLPVLAATPPTLVGQDQASGRPAFCPAPIPTTTTVVLGGGGGSQPAPAPQCVQVRCGVSGACRDHLVSLYQDWSHWLDPLFQAAATLGVAVAVATLPWDWLLDLEAGLVIKSGIVTMLQGFGSAITGNLLPVLDVDLQHDIQRALFDHLTCVNEQVQVSADNVAAWKAALDAMTTWPIPSLAGPFCGLLLQYTPLARWQAAALTASPSTACDAWP